jgi:hypothetical protein
MVFHFRMMVRRGAKFCASTSNTENEIKTGANFAPVFYQIILKRMALR